MGPLLIRPAPMEGESLRGYLLRLGEANGLESALLREALRFYSAGNRSVLVALAALCGCEVAQLPQTWTSQSKGLRQKTWVYGVPLPPAMVRIERCAVCPQCLRARVGVRAEWEIDALCVCPDHGCHLINVCPCCKRPIQWCRPGVAVCKCGFDLCHAPQSKATPEAIALSTLISDRLRGFAVTAAPQSLGFHKDLMGMNLNVLLQTIGYIGLLHSEHCTKGAAVSASSARTQQIKKSTSVAHSLTDWPTNFRTALRQAARATANAEERLCDIHVLEWPHPIFRLSPSKEKARRMGIVHFVRDEAAWFRNRQSVRVGAKVFFLLCERPAPLPKKDWGGHFNDQYQTIRDHHLVSTVATARALGVSPSRLGELIDAGALPFARGPVPARELALSIRRLFDTVVGVPRGHRRLQTLLSAKSTDATRFSQTLRALSRGSSCSVFRASGARATEADRCKARESQGD